MSWDTGSRKGINHPLFCGKKTPLLGLKIEVVNDWEFAESPLDLAAPGVVIVHIAS